jgi:hypothetical protein
MRSKASHFGLRPPVKQLTEVRWFIPGDGPSLEKSDGRAHIDSYYRDQLADGVSVKWRHAEEPGTLFKLRIGVHAPVLLEKVQGTPETWIRVMLLARLDSDADRIDVSKRVTRRNGVEVALLEFAQETWWSLALRIRDSDVPAPPRPIVAHLNRYRDLAVACSYPAWLLTRIERDPPRVLGPVHPRYANGGRVDVIGALPN